MRAESESWERNEPDPAVLEKDIQFSTRDGTKLRIHVFAPASQSFPQKPLVVMYHGGGFSIGKPEGTSLVCKIIVKAFGAVCVAPQYRLAPEHPFPTGVNDSWDSLSWIAANASSQLDASPEHGFIVGGSSAGANFACVLSHLARDEKLSPPLTGTYLAAASVLPVGAVVPGKYKDRYLSAFSDACVNSPILDKNTKQVFADSAKADLRSPLRAPFNWPEPSAHSGLPPTYLQVCGMDVSRDESLLYEQMLREDYSLKTRLDIYPGQPHIFWSVFSKFKQTQKFRQDLVEGFSWLLGAKVEAAMSSL